MEKNSRILRVVFGDGSGHSSVVTSTFLGMTSLPNMPKKSCNDMAPLPIADAQRSRNISGEKVGFFNSFATVSLNISASVISFRRAKFLESKGLISLLNNSGDIGSIILGPVRPDALAGGSVAFIKGFSSCAPFSFLIRAASIALIRCLAFKRRSSACVSFWFFSDIRDCLTSKNSYVKHYVEVLS